MNMEDKSFLYINDNGILISKEAENTVIGDIYNLGSKFQLCSDDNLCPESSNDCFKFEICAANSDQSLSKIRYDSIHNIVSRNSGYENDANSPPILASRVGILGIGIKRSEFIVLEVSGTNNQLALEEVYIEGIPFQRLKQVMSPIQNSEEENPK